MTTTNNREYYLKTSIITGNIREAFQASGEGARNKRVDALRRMISDGIFTREQIKTWQKEYPELNEPSRAIHQ